MAARRDRHASAAPQCGLLRAAGGPRAPAAGARAVRRPPTAPWRRRALPPRVLSIIDADAAPPDGAMAAPGRPVTIPATSAARPVLIRTGSAACPASPLAIAAPDGPSRPSLTPPYLPARTGASRGCMFSAASLAICFVR